MPILLCLATLLGMGTPQEKAAKNPAETPAGKPDKTVTRVPVAALVLSDEDGSLPCQITAEQVKAWIADANLIYKPAKIQFDFTGDDSDFVAVKNTALNHIIDPESPDFAEAARAGNAFAAKYPDKIMLVFRHGGRPVPSGSGFGSIQNDYVTLPQFDRARTCYHQNLHGAAQWIGQYLGIKPTAAKSFINIPEAEQFLHDHKDDPDCFDGDGIKDTPPDPLIITVEGICQPTGNVVIGDTNFALPVENLMSDYDSPKTLSGTQIKWVQWAMRTRLKNGMGTPTNIAALPSFKADKLAIAAKKDCETSVQTLTGWNAARWNGSSQLLCAAKKGGSLTLTLTVAEEGEYKIDLYATQAPDFGITQIYLDEKPLGKPFDGWAPYVMPTGRLEFGVVKLKKGPRRIRFVATDKYELSTDYHFGLDSLRVQPVEK